MLYESMRRLEVAGEKLLDVHWWRQVLTENLEVATLIFYSTNDKRTDSNR